MVYSLEEKIKQLRSMLRLFDVETKECALCGKYEATDFMEECHPGSELYCEECPGCKTCSAAHTCEVCGWIGEERELRACHEGGEPRYCDSCCCETCGEAINAEDLRVKETASTSPEKAVKVASPEREIRPARSLAKCH